MSQNNNANAQEMWRDESAQKDMVAGIGPGDRRKDLNAEHIRDTDKRLKKHGVWSFYAYSVLFYAVWILHLFCGLFRGDTNAEVYLLGGLTAGYITLLAVILIGTSAMRALGNLIRDDIN